MRAPEAPKLKLGKPRVGKRSRYWSLHELPTKKISHVPNMQKRLAAESMSIVSVVAELGARSDVTVLKMRPADLVMNRAFAEHQQKLSGALHRLRKHSPWTPLPTHLAKLHQLSAFKAIEESLKSQGVRL